MPTAYLGLAVLAVVAALICAVMVTASWLLGPKKVTPYKVSPYECGVAPVGSARERFPIKFYLVAILFVLFDIEVVFLWGWLTIYRTAEPAFKIFSYVEVVVYMATWILGYVYAIRVNAIDWDETVSLSPEKLGSSPSPFSTLEKRERGLGGEGQPAPVGGGS